MRLLLVEDDVMVASGIKLGLTDAGYAVAARVIAPLPGHHLGGAEFWPAGAGHGEPHGIALRSIRGFGYRLKLAADGTA